ncbi:murein hydrolase activator EnvC family protein [Gallalistipes aquisgranensis]|uniref:murein hydrolase activator EnvC family protein n=1 Tax=Gallalistipes aquisgranensis TaxID=2779358 RepID=UPI001CF8AD77|nr:peptidoglycan DD-metalloendopeptidase family protein [Gallalistipes aquisgranensis]MBE5034467.1 peptidoglycan DD-metalloendopeptidase family protein [Gallalistipes aquisgranensis]
MIKRLCILLFLVLGAGSVGAQSLESLREQIRRAEEEIRINTELLNKTRKDQRMTQSQLKLIQSRIRNRQNIVRSLEKQIDLINTDINGKSDTVKLLTARLDALKEDYASMIRAAYKNYKLNNFLVFLFASKDFNDATRRIAFMKRYNRMREIKAAEIDSVSKRLSGEISALDTQRAQLDQTRSSRTRELASLGKDETQYRGAVNQLKARESKISRELRTKKAQIERAQQQIQRIIAEEARKSKATPKSAAQKQADYELSGRFDQNMGRLPYPIRGGVVIDRYGVHAHPTQKGLTINNKGVNIAGERGAAVHCVFEGTVSRIFFFQGLNNNVMIRHGNFITVYSNLASVHVKTGDKVTTGQVIGRIPDSDNDDDCMLHFEIWKETQNLNPESWLRR